MRRVRSALCGALVDLVVRVGRDERGEDQVERRAPRWWWRRLVRRRPVCRRVACASPDARRRHKRQRQAERSSAKERIAPARHGPWRARLATLRANPGPCLPYPRKPKRPDGLKSGSRRRYYVGHRASGAYGCLLAKTGSSCILGSLLGKQQFQCHKTTAGTGRYVVDPPTTAEHNDVAFDIGEMRSACRTMHHGLCGS